MNSSPVLSLNIKGNLFHFDEPKVMGILNVTPDSFFDGGTLSTEKLVLQRAEKMLEEGADFLDVGGASSRPGAEIVSIEEELNRVLPAIKSIAKEFPKAIMSIDSFHAQVAKQAVETGAHIVNDISAGDDDPAMFETVKELQVPYIIMHKQGQPQNMQQNPEYNDVTQDVLYYLAEKVQMLNRMGVKDIIIDPGFGFGKTVEHNYELLQKLELFHHMELPVLVGVSRKSMINRVLGTKPEEALNGTSVLNTVALQKGTHILRVHDVKEAVQAVKLCKKLQSVSTSA